MALRDYGFNRRRIREGSGTGEGVASEHFDEMIGTVDLYMYRHPSRKIKGYEPLKAYLESQSCEVTHTGPGQTPLGPRYETIRVSGRGSEIAVPALRRAHSWAHQRNLLHLFYKKG